MCLDLKRSIHPRKLKKDKIVYKIVLESFTNDVGLKCYHGGFHRFAGGYVIGRATPTEDINDEHNGRIGLIHDALNWIIGYHTFGNKKDALKGFEIAGDNFRFSDCYLLKCIIPKGTKCISGIAQSDYWSGLRCCLSETVTPVEIIEKISNGN